jgi:hypothetical protein
LKKLVSIIPATYNETGVQRFGGNPFIEAMPPLETTKAAFLTGLSHYPPAPTAATRKANEIVRLMELSTLNDVVFPFPEYQKAALAIATIMRDAYVSRNPLTVLDRQRRHALATNGADGLPFPSSWKSSAKGHFMMAVSGMGKTTFANAFLLRYPQVISHDGYNGQHLKCQQIVYIVLRVPHDATLRSLCIQFFQEVDSLLQTNYVRQANSLRNIAPMVQLMSQVATAVSLGFLVVDELQNLRNARGGDANFVLNLFSEIIERLGISLLAIATPAVQPVFEGSVRNARKIASYGETVLKPMKKNDPLWQEFCETYWVYSFVKKKVPLRPEVMNAWYDVSAGNTAFAALAFMLAQRNEIGGREVVDESAFARTAATDMAFLQPAVSALKSGKPAKLRAFDDLLFSPQYRALRAALGASEPAEEKKVQDEFDDVNDEPEQTRKGRSGSRADKRTPDAYFDGTLPTEDPLAR